VSERPDIAYLAALHALTLKVFYAYRQDSCLELDFRSVGFPAQTPGLADSGPARTLRQQRQSWSAALPKQPEALWETLAGWDEDSRQALFAFVVAESVNAVIEPYHRRPRAIAHADQLAQAVDLDVAASWTPTADTFLGRVTKARILAAVAEAKGQPAADRIRHFRKGEMAERAQELLAGSGWLPEPLRTPGRPIPSPEAAGAAPDPETGAFINRDDAGPDGEETAADDAEPADAVSPAAGEAAYVAAE
jgi:ParB family chromosome partitioning protein